VRLNRVQNVRTDERGRGEARGAVTHLLSPLLSRCDVHSSKNSEIVCEVDAVSVCSIPITTASGRYSGSTVRIVDLSFVRLWSLSSVFESTLGDHYQLPGSSFVSFLRSLPSFSCTVCVAVRVVLSFSLVILDVFYRSRAPHAFCLRAGGGGGED
jgi:hypothetical protein